MSTRAASTPIRIRRETQADVAAITAVTAAAFATDGDDDPPAEASLVTALRADAGWIPQLTLLAEADGAVVGHVVCHRAGCGDRPALGLGPISVAPPWQGAGVGTGLMRAVLGAAAALGEPLVALLGDPGFYARFGFVTAADVGVKAPDVRWGAHFQALALVADHPRGTFRYAAPFDRL